MLKAIISGLEGRKQKEDDPKNVVSLSKKSICRYARSENQIDALTFGIIYLGPSMCF